MTNPAVPSAAGNAATTNDDAVNEQAELSTVTNPAVPSAAGNAVSPPVSPTESAAGNSESSAKDEIVDFMLARQPSKRTSRLRVIRYSPCATCVVGQK